MKPETLAHLWELIDDYGAAVYWGRDHDVDRIRSDINAILSRHVEFRDALPALPSEPVKP